MNVYFTYNDILILYQAFQIALGTTPNIIHQDQYKGKGHDRGPKDALYNAIGGVDLWVVGLLAQLSGGVVAGETEDGHHKPDREHVGFRGDVRGVEVVREYERGGLFYLIRIRADLGCGIWDLELIWGWEYYGRKESQNKHDDEGSCELLDHCEVVQPSHVVNPQKVNNRVNHIDHQRKNNLLGHIQTPRRIIPSKLTLSPIN